MIARVWADVTPASEPARIHAALLTAVIAYDQRQARGRSYNRYALPQYLAGLQRAEQRVAAGAPWREALIACFCGRLLDVALKALHLAPSTRDEQRF